MNVRREGVSTGRWHAYMITYHSRINKGCVNKMMG